MNFRGKLWGLFKIGFRGSPHWHVTLNHQTSRQSAQRTQQRLWVVSCGKAAIETQANERVHFEKRHLSNNRQTIVLTSRNWRLLGVQPCSAAATVSRRGRSVSSLYHLSRYPRCMMLLCIHTYVCGAYMHTYVPTYLHTCIPTYLHTYISTYLHTYMTTYLHTYVPTYLHTQTCMLNNMCKYVCLGPWPPLCEVVKASAASSAWSIGTRAAARCRSAKKSTEHNKQ